MDGPPATIPAQSPQPAASPLPRATSLLASEAVQEHRASRWYRIRDRGGVEPQVGVRALGRGDEGGVRGSSMSMSTYVQRRTGGVILYTCCSHTDGLNAK